MRVRTLEIRWHDSKPINSCDFQPAPSKKARPANERDFASQSYRLATAGEDNNVRSASASGSSVQPTPHPPRVEYLSTLSKHHAPVNVVRFSPNGELIASAGDDGMVIVWSPSASAPNAAYGSEPDEHSYEKEFWKARTPFRCSTMQVYDLAWSPTGEYIIAGSTDNTARIFNSVDGKCLREIAEHSHFVQGVAWDPLNEYIATQSSDRAVHVYNFSTKHGTFDMHAVGRNMKMNVRASRTPSVGVGRKRPRSHRKESTASDAESAIASDRDEIYPPPPPVSMPIPMTPAPSIASTPSASGPAFMPPPSERTMSRRSSFSSVAPGSPAPSHYSASHTGRSPSPMPPLPAIRAPPSPQLIAQSRLYGDESFTNFYRRLTFSPDGALLLTPSGHFEDPSNIASLMAGESSSRGRRGNPADSTLTDPTSASSVFIYSRANFARPPIAQLPGHKKASVAVRFSPVLYDLRPGVTGAQAPPEPRTVNVAVERGNSEQIDIDMVGPLPLSASAVSTSDPQSQGVKRPDSRSQSRVGPSPSPQTPHPSQTLPSPALSAVDGPPQTPAQRSATPSTAGTSTSAGVQAQNTHQQTGSVFALPYRMLFAVATMDTITIHDTQQASPIALLTKLHYDEFTDMTWSPDGQCLMLTSRDGYCTIVIFDQILPAHHTQQHALQLQSIALVHQHGHHTHHAHSHSQVSGSTSTSTHVTPLPTPAKRTAPLPPLDKPVSSAGTSTSAPPESATSGTSVVSASSELATAQVSPATPEVQNTEPDNAKPASSTSVEPPKKKRRVALTRVGDVDS
ncbi:WD40 repeat-like protein [Fomitiporia mediterranea MF3/22]|uniref:WD40 repeat-like protein n=1 Tax=Fomitiporia mediterranea (strain MF3/22) TaxID=694068 RepID=UPI0004409256|nr:WD40 repeat-like protein [Fomitiporia mediterranea MF3/22]EJD01898.1 WD40 repeat-like protein [Fomitiporia mediterranea MF3/22]